MFSPSSSHLRESEASTHAKNNDVNFAAADLIVSVSTVRGFFPFPVLEPQPPVVGRHIRKPFFSGIILSHGFLIGK